jgi:hypothetical protein
LFVIEHNRFRRALQQWFLLDRKILPSEYALVGLCFDKFIQAGITCEGSNDSVNNELLIEHEAVWGGKGNDGC